MKVLIAEDEPVSRRLLEASLTRWGYEVIVASDGCEASRILQQPDAPNLALLDWLMPGIDGVELCRQIRQRKANAYTYVLLLTTKRTHESVIEGLEAGADDYLTKPFNARELQVRLRTGKRIVYLTEQLVTTRDALRDLASHDALTGLLNRAATLDILDKELGRANRQGSPLGLILLDLDFFKAINDTYGHAMGDEILRNAARAMSSTVRPYDTIGRYGGEEFLVVLPGCDQMNAVSHAERLRMAISRIAVTTQDGEKVQVNASFGVAVFGSHGRQEAFELIQAADAALYRVKKAGRNRVESAIAQDLVPA